MLTLRKVLYFTSKRALEEFLPLLLRPCLGTAQRLNGQKCTQVHVNCLIYDSKLARPKVYKVPGI